MAKKLIRKIKNFLKGKKDANKASALWEELDELFKTKTPMTEMEETELCQLEWKLDDIISEF